jgi:ferredoxin
MESSEPKTLEQISLKLPSIKLKDGISPIELNRREFGEPTRITFSDNGSANSACIRCIEPPCIKYSTEEITVRQMPEFPADLDDSVCPSQAIQWPTGSFSPLVDRNLCCGCSLCLMRCPVAAIYIDEEGTAAVQGQPNEYFIECEEPVSQENIEELIRLFCNASQGGSIPFDDDIMLEKLHEKIIQVAAISPLQFPNLLARNLLCEIGLRSAIRRRGDVNIRMDLVFETGYEVNGICEVEFRPETMLEAPRDILDDIAVAISRYKWDREKLVPIIIGLSLPNQRSEFWQVMQDIDTALNIKIGCLTIISLINLMRAMVNINDDNINMLFPDLNNYSIRENINRLLQQDLSAANGFLGIYESSK